MALLFEKTCECGCGQVVNLGRRFIHNHHLKGKPSGMKGKCHSKNTKRKISEALKGKRKSEEHRRKMSETLKGRNLTSEWKEKISNALRGKPSGRKGTHHTEEVKRKISKALKGRKKEPRTFEHCKKLSISNKGKKRTSIQREKMSQSQILAYKEGRHPGNRVGISGDFYSKKNKKKLHYRSLLEKGWYQVLEKLSKVEWYEVESLSIPYLWEGFVHRYLPDLLVKYTDGTMELIEIKPEYQWEDERNLAKWKAARKWCESRKRRETEFRVVGYEGLRVG